MFKQNNPQWCITDIGDEPIVIQYTDYYKCHQAIISQWNRKPGLNGSWCDNNVNCHSTNGYRMPSSCNIDSEDIIPDDKVHGANMGPTWVLLAPDGPHVVPMDLDIRVIIRDMSFFLYGCMDNCT